MNEHERIRAPFASSVTGFATTRAGGVSQPPYDRLNLGDAAGDDPADVAANRARLAAIVPGPLRWLRQVHGARVIHLDDWQPGVEADAVWTDRPGEVVAVLTADCLPVLIAADDGSRVAAVHAGWRGLAAGVLEAAVAEIRAPATRLQAWIGPRIGAAAYEVDAAVRDAFPGAPSAFVESRPGHWLADLPAIAAERLRSAGVAEVLDCGLCTASDPGRFFSHRRDGASGRQASLAWIDPAA
jgi:YfiH family protein